MPTKTEDELLDAQFEELVEARVQKRIEEIKRQPVGRFPFSGKPIKGGDPAEPDNPAPVRKVWSGSLKNIDLYDGRRENEKLAYGFFKFIQTIVTPPGSQPHTKALEYLTSNGYFKALGEGTNEDGGALVPPEFDAMLIRLIERFGVFRGFARLSNMRGDTKSQPRRTAGVTAAWVGEGQAITAGNQKYDNIMLVAKKLAALVVLSSEISEDAAINIADDTAFEIGYSFATAEDQAGFNGDGSSTFGGITGVTQKLKGLSGTIANIAGLVVAAGNLFSEVLLSDFTKVVALLPEYADGPNTAWFCHRTFYFGTILPLILAAGGVEAREVMEGDRRPRPMFLGYPVNFCQAMPKTDANSQVACLFGDLRLAAVFGDRRRRTLFTDPYSLSANDQIQIRGTERIDAVCHDAGNATSVAADKQPGPIVGLISAAS